MATTLGRYLVIRIVYARYNRTESANRLQGPGEERPRAEGPVAQLVRARA